MNQSIPGSVKVDGREFVYVEASSARDAWRLVCEALESNSQAPLPNDGGIIEGRVRIVLPNGRSLFSVSYKGDVAGWRRKLTEEWKERSIFYGIVSEGEIDLADGTSVGFEEIVAEFDV